MKSFFGLSLIGALALALLFGYYHLVCSAYESLTGHSADGIVISMFILYELTYKLYVQITGKQAPPWRTIYWEKNIACALMATVSLFAGHFYSIRFPDSSLTAAGISLVVTLIIVAGIPALYVIGEIIMHQHKSRQEYYREKAKEAIRQ